MRYLSLFSGIEACTVAWKPLGWECVAVAEIEPFPCAVLAHHYPNVPNLGDVTKITEQRIKELGQIDLVVFGSPCQNLSVAGNRKGLQGESSGLFYEAIRLIQYARKHCGARFALWENVPGAFSSNKGNDFREVVRELSANRDINTPKNGWGSTGVALGENGLVEWRVLDAQYFGLAQRRKRVFAIVDFGNWQDRPPILLEPKGVCGDTPPSRETGQKATANTQISTVREGSFGSFVDSEVAGTLKASGGVLGGGSESLFVEKPVFFETRYDDEVVRLTKDDLSPTLTAGMGTAGSNYINTAYSIIADATPKIGDEICGTLTCGQNDSIRGDTPLVMQSPVVSIAGNIIGRSPQNGGNGDGFDEEVCYTLTTVDRHAVAANSIIRRLTPKECEILQGFPPFIEIVSFKICLDHQNKNVLVETLCHKLQSSVLIAGANELQRIAKIVEKNLNTHQAEKEMLVAENVPMPCEVKILAKHNAEKLNSLVFIAETSKRYRLLIAEGDIAQQPVPTLIELEKNHHHGKAGLQPSMISFTAQKNGNQNAAIYGKSIEGSVQNAEIDLKGVKYTISEHGQNSPTTDLQIQTLFSCVMTAISGCIQNQTPIESFYIHLMSVNDYTKIPYRKKDIDQCPDSPRYKALGNSMAVPVMAWIGKQIQKAVAYV